MLFRSQEWSVSNGIYSSSNANVLKAFKLFVAPMWIGAEHYVSLAKATIQEVDGQLVMKLWAGSDNVGLFPDGYAVKDSNGNYLFAQAIISK